MWTPSLGRCGYQTGLCSVQEPGTHHLQTAAVALATNPGAADLESLTGWGSKVIVTSPSVSGNTSHTQNPDEPRFLLNLTPSHACMQRLLQVALNIAVLLVVFPVLLVVFPVLWWFFQFSGGLSSPLVVWPVLLVVWPVLHVLYCNKGSCSSIRTKKVL